MQDNSKLLEYISRAVNELTARGMFENGWKFRPSQKAALEAYDTFLQSDVSDEYKLKGFFEIPTGVGKTAVFGAIVAGVHNIAAEDKKDFSTMIVVPTVNLIDQTFKAIHESSPSLDGQVGLYDGSRKQLDKAVTVITYDSWMTLLEEEKISAENTDLLISDEAHRGTSERRVDNVFEAYDYKEDQVTARLAFTATGRFDEEKSVQNSHKNKIFSRPIKDSVKDGELAEYISVQRYVIRVMPNDVPLTGNFAEAADEAEDKQALRREGWNQRMLHILKHGTDKVTDDPLSDNQGAWFVSNTAHADRCEAMLNADPELQQLVKDRGLKGVAVAVHSSIPKKLNERRLKDYEAGKYLTIVGDSQLKEGWDHPPMKTVFDYQRSSLVDKGQILGRGARRWHNEAKQRYEGMTFIDSVVYVGDDDPKKDQKLYANALEHAILAFDVLEETFCLRKGSSAQLPKARKDGGTPLFGNDPNVEEYTTLDDLHLIQAERADLRAATQERRDELASYVEITPEQLKMLKAEEKRTGLGGAALFKKIAKPLEGMTAARISAINGRQVSTAPEGWLEFILKEYRTQPDNNLVIISEKNLIELKAEKERTGLGGRALLNKMSNPPEGMDRNKIANIINGLNKSAPDGWVECILGEYKKHLSVVVLAPAQFKALKAEEERTGLGGAKLFNKMSNPPEGMDAVKLSSIMCGKVKSMPAGWMAYIFEELKLQPSINLTVITPKQLKILKAEKERTGLGGAGFLSRVKKPLEGMTAARLDRIIPGDMKSIPIGWVEYMLKEYKLQPSVDIITPNQLGVLQAEKERTGLGGAALLSKMSNPPEGMTAVKLQGVIAGKLKTLPLGWIGYVLEEFKNQPDNNLTVITSKQSQTLKAEQKRTNLGGKALFSKMKRPLEGMTASKLDSIVCGKTTNISMGWVEHILMEYKAQPTITVITLEQSQALKGEQKRTGLGGRALFNTITGSLEGLTAGKSDKIVSGRAKTALVVHLSIIFSAYAKQPDKNLAPPLPDDPTGP